MAFSGTPFMFDEPVVPTGGGASPAPQGALESTLELVKKSLWDVEHNTQQTQSRLAQDNASGPTHFLKGISKWSAENYVLDIITETLVEIRDSIDTSAIARKSDSPLEKSLNNIRESTVSFNEKTLRWHDDQTNLMVKGSDPRVAEAMKPKPSMLATAGAAVSGGAKNVWGGIKGLFSKEGKPGKDQKMDSSGLFVKKSPEEVKEAKVEDDKDDKVQKTQDTSLKGIWAAMKERGKKSWFAENWKMILAGLIFLFAPLKWIKKLWEFVKVAWDFTKKHPFMVIIGLVAAKIFGLGNILKLGFKMISGTFGIIKKLLMKIPFKKLGSAIASGARTAGGAIASGARTAGGVIKTGAIRAVEGSKAIAGKAVEGLKSAGGAVKKGAGNIASASKGIFGSIVKKFGAAGKWIMKLGSKLIMPLVTTPVGWAILAGLAIGGLVYVFWDEIKAGLKAALGMMTAAIDKVKSMFSGLDIMAGLKSFLPGWLVDMIGPSKKKEPEKVEQPSGEVTEKTDKSRRAKSKKDFKARHEAEEKGYIDQSFWTGGIKSINREAMTRDLNNGELTRDMLVGMLDSGDLSKKRGKKGAVDETASDYEYVETALKLFPAPKPVKAEVIHGSTGDEPSETAPQISAPPISDFKTDKLSAAMERSSGRSLASYRDKDAPSSQKRLRKRKMQMELMSPTGELTWNKLTDKEKKRFKLQGDKMGFTAAQSPDDKMNTMNDINTKNQTLQSEKSGSPVIISNTTNASASTANSTSLIPLTTTVHAPKLTTSLPS
jgi:hypothetical protein